MDKAALAALVAHTESVVRRSVEKFTLTAESHPALYAVCALAQLQSTLDVPAEFVGNEFCQIGVDLLMAESQAASSLFCDLLELIRQDPTQELGLEQETRVGLVSEVLLAVFP